MDPRRFLILAATALVLSGCAVFRGEAMELAERRYVSTVYFHTLFLFAVTKSRKYALQRGEGDANVDVEVADYVADLFSSSYAQFLLSFDTGDLIDALG